MADEPIDCEMKTQSISAWRDWQQRQELSSRFRPAFSKHDGGAIPGNRGLKTRRIL